MHINMTYAKVKDGDFDSSEVCKWNVHFDLAAFFPVLHTGDYTCLHLD